MNIWMRRIAAALPWLGIAAVSCVAMLLALFPAAWVTPQVAKATQGHVNFIDPQGSLWNGSATLMLAAGTDASGATVLPGRVEWQTAFWPLLTGRFHVSVRQTDAMPKPTTLDATWGGAKLSASDIALPAALLSGLGAPFNTLDLKGTVHVAWTEWHLIRKNLFGRFDVTLNDMVSRVSQVKPLGSYRILLQAQGAASTLDLSTLKGPLLLSGHGTITANGTSFHGEASSAPQERDNLGGLLNLLGRPTGTGTVALDYNR